MVIDALFKKNPEEPADDRPAPCHKQIWASLKGKAAALKQLAEKVALRDRRSIRARVALTDGAIALQQQMQAHLSNFTLVLDVIHVDEYVWKAGTAVYDETDPRRAVWVEQQMLDILSSRVVDVIHRLEEKPKHSPNGVRLVKPCVKSPTTSNATKPIWTMQLICAEDGRSAPV